MSVLNAHEPAPSLASIFSVQQVGARRLEFLPRLFGPKKYVLGEALTYRFLKRFCEEYEGGFWEFFELSNGGHYMRPEICAKTIHFRVESNWFDGHLSPDAAGLAVTLFSLGALAQDLRDAVTADIASLQFHLVRDFVLEHPERSLILGAID